MIVVAAVAAIVAIAATGFAVPLGDAAAACVADWRVAPAAESVAVAYAKLTLAC
jgi:hypothetical protein